MLCYMSSVVATRTELGCFKKVNEMTLEWEVFLFTNQILSFRIFFNKTLF